jgi:hypothetical protein
VYQTQKEFAVSNLEMWKEEEIEITLYEKESHANNTIRMKLLVTKHQ